MRVETCRNRVKSMEFDENSRVTHRFEHGLEASIWILRKLEALAGAGAKERHREGDL